MFGDDDDERLHVPSDSTLEDQIGAAFFLVFIFLVCWLIKVFGELLYELFF